MDSRVEYFPENLGDYSEGQGERSNQDIKADGIKYVGGVLLDVEKRFASEQKKNAATKIFRI